MSINHYSSMETTPLWWTQQHQQQIEPILQNQPQPTWFNQTGEQDPHPQTNTPSRFNLNNQNDDEEDENDDDQAVTTTTAQHGTENDKLEPMFEKPLTPSDVGKLNRLVIPKQHAEKYFPLSGNGGGDSGGECKGLLLSFEDESGKCWRFRYSYWNSSQSYVLTKGWSRYVKDKRLDAGDVVLFQRHRSDAQRLFIGWRRRRTSGAATGAATQGSRMVGHGKSSSNSNGGGGDGNEVGGGGWTRGFYSAHPYPAHHSMPYQHDSLHAGLAIYPFPIYTHSNVSNSTQPLSLI